MRITELLAEAKNPKMQAAIAINMKKRHQKPKSEGVSEGLHPMIIDDVKKLATLSPTDRYSAYANIRDYFKADPALSKMASDLMGGYYEADMLRGKYKTDAAKAKYAELEPMNQAFIKQALGQEQGVAEESKGLWANIHAKRERIKNGSGEHMRKPGSKGAPTASALKKSATEDVAEDLDDNQKSAGQWGPTGRHAKKGDLVGVSEGQKELETIKRLLGK
jgi:hypothetical protein